MSKTKRHHRSYFPIRWMLVFYDIIIFAAVVLFALVLYFSNNFGNMANLTGEVWLQILYHFLIGNTILVISRFFFRVYGQIWRYGGVQSYIRLMFADGCALLLYYLVQKFVPIFNPSIGAFAVLAIVLADTVIALAVRMWYRFTYKRLNRHTKFGRFIVKCVNFFGRSDWTIDNSSEPTDKIRIAIVGAGKPAGITDR